MIFGTFTVDRTPSRVGLIDASAGTVLDLDAQYKASVGNGFEQFKSMLALIEGEAKSLDMARRMGELAAADGRFIYPLSSVRLLAPVPVPEQIREFSVYEQHVRDAPVRSATAKARFFGEKVDPGLADRPVPKVFFTQPAYYHCNRFNVIGPEEEVRWPSYSSHLDYELEIGMFIGKAGRNIREDQAAKHIFGYTIYNDISAREQMWREMETRMGPSKGKSFDTANVLGPWIVTPDEIGNVQALDVEVRINGESWARNTTANMLHSFEEMIAYISRDETLRSGELFCSGTVGGCSGLEIDRWLKPGDLMELEVSRIGVLRNRIVKSLGAGS